MKKLALVAALVTLAGFVVYTEARNVPAPTTNGYPATALYGGVDIATSAFSANIVTVTAHVAGTPLNVLASTDAANIRGPWVVYGVQFSSGNCGNYDFVDVYDSSTAYNAHNDLGVRPTLRLYNHNGTTQTSVANNASCSGFSGTPLPVKFSKGLFFKPSAATYNSIQLLFHRND